MLRKVAEGISVPLRKAGGRCPPIVYVLDCGGTISMTSTENGIVSHPDALDFERLIYENGPRLYRHNKLTRDLVEVKTIPKFIDRDSSYAKPFEWTRIAKEVTRLRRVERADGIVITHGTDTASELCAALSYLLKEQDIPVTITGAQKSARKSDGSIDYSSDAFRNIQDATYVAAYYGHNNNFYPTLTFNRHILFPENVIKTNVWSEDAYHNIGNHDLGSPDLSESGGVYVDGANLQLGSPQTSKELNFFKYRKWDDEPCNMHIDETPLDTKVTICPTKPGMSTESFSAMLESNDGAVIEGMGAGHAPSEILPIIKEHSIDGIPIAVCARPKGLVDIANGYGPGMDLLKAGVSERGGTKTSTVMHGGQYRADFAYIKLMYLTSHAKDISSVAISNGVAPENLLHSLFITGTRYRSPLSLRKYMDVTGVEPALNFYTVES